MVVGPWLTVQAQSVRLRGGLSAALATLALYIGIETNGGDGETVHLHDGLRRICGCRLIHRRPPAASEGRRGEAGSVRLEHPTVQHLVEGRPRDA